MKNKKKVPKTLGKFSLGGSTKFNESGFNVDNSTSQSDNIYNQKRGNKISANQYAAYGQAAMNMGTQLAANRELSGEERQYADNQTMNNGVDSIAGNALPWYGMAKGASNVGKSFIPKDENGNITSGGGKAANEIMTADHQHMINDINNKNYTALGLDSMGLGKFARMASDITGNSDKTTGGWGKFNKFVGISPNNQYAQGGMNITPNAEGNPVNNGNTGVNNPNLTPEMINYILNNMKKDMKYKRTIEDIPMGYKKEVKPLYHKMGFKKTLSNLPYNMNSIPQNNLQQDYREPDLKFANGGVQYSNGGTGQINAEVEKEENSLSPNGEFTQFNGNSHSQGGIKTDLPGNSMIFSDRLKVPGTKKTFADLNKTNNTNKEDKILSSNKYGNISKHTAELMKFAKNKNSETLFNEQESLKQAKVQAYAKRMGVILPSNDNEQNESQGLSEQSEGEYAYGGIHNKLPMYPNGGESDTLGKKVVSVPSNYSFDRQVGNKKVFIDPGSINKAKKYNTIPQKNNNYNQFLIDKLKSGISPEELSRQGYGTLKGLQPLISNYNPKRVYIEPFNDENKKQAFTTPMATSYDQRIDRKEVVFDGNKNIKYFDYPDTNAGYSKSTRVAFDSNSGTEIDPSKSYDAQGNYKPYFNLNTGRDYYSNTIKSSIPGTNPNGINLIKRENIDTPLNTQTANQFKYGGKMLPKYAYGDLTPEQQFAKVKFMGAEQNQRNLAFNQMIGNTKPGFSTYNNELQNTLPSSYAPGTLGYNDSMNSPANPYIEPKEKSYEESAEAQNRRLEREARDKALLEESDDASSQEDQTYNEKFNWKNAIGQVGMGLLQNAGNIYNLSRYNKPEIERYERAQAKYLDDSAAIRDATDQTRRAEYNVRGASGGNAGTYLSNRVALNAQNIINKDRIRQQYANSNAQIGNQVNQFNTDIAMREVIANAQNRARTRSGKEEAISQIGSNVANQILDNRKGNMDQETLQLMMKYYNKPEFQKYMRESNLNKKNKKSKE